MKIELFNFQQVALSKLRMNVATALGNYRATHTPQVVSYTAPTGAGKTIVMSALIESIYYGDGVYPDQPDAIFVWLSDSPQLNEQSKNKIDFKADKIRLNQCVTINDESFDRETLEDGHIYFLNTQKLSKTSNLTKHSDSRTYTIWETLANTVAEKSDRLYFIIDEAHRGAQKSTELARATTIMQKFLKGSEADKLPPMPVVIGMTATAQRFNRLAEGIQSTTHYVVTTPDEVRASGLLKDRIVITYPETTGNDMAVLQAATDEWKHKWEHWAQYCYEQHYAHVNPVFVIQVQNGNASRISATDLDECIRCIEERTGERFAQGQVVHAFGETNSAITINGLTVPYVEPSRIADDRKIKVVFFKETLSTGWDCPRAETMMSFRRAVDYTYIAQLLGRMVRTPMQMHINVDDTLNDVHLYLPQFDETTVYEVVDALNKAEGATIPADVISEEIGDDNYVTYGLRPTYQSSPFTGGSSQMSFGDSPEPPTVNAGGGYTTPRQQQGNGASTPLDQYLTQQNGSTETGNETTDTGRQQNAGAPVQEQPKQQKSPAPSFDREAVVKAINDAGLLTYNVRKVVISDYLKSMYALARFLVHTRINFDAIDNVVDDIVKMIHDYIEIKKNAGMYKSLAEQVMQFKLSTQIFDVFGKTIDNYEIHDLFSTTDTDIDRQFRLAENRLGNEGVGLAYLREYCQNGDYVSGKIDVILFAADASCMAQLQDYAKDKFHQLNDDHRRQTVVLPERFKKKYDDIVSDGDIVSKHNFRLPETIRVSNEKAGKVYYDHLFVDDSGAAKIELNNWEKKVIEEEEKQDDFVCWLRNPPRKPWALCIPYEIDGVKRPTYPDFLIIRKYNDEYIVDILEPHDPSRTDNLGKAKGFAEYARQNPGVGRIQLIRMERDPLGVERPYRLDMSKSSIRDKVSHCVSDTELKHLFDDYGFFI